MEIKLKYHIFILILPLLVLACVASKPKQKPLPTVTTSQGFYMVFRNLPDSTMRADFIGTDPVLARQGFYKHILQMVQDRAFQQASPTAYDQAWDAGKKLSRLYTIQQDDPTLQEVFERIEPLP